MRAFQIAICLLCLCACDYESPVEGNASSLPTCPTVDPLGILDNTAECRPELASGGSLDDPLDLFGDVTPQNVVRNVTTLAEASSILNICFESDKFQDLDTEMALHLFELDSRLGKVVTNISDHYKDEALYLSYELMAVELSDDVEYKKYAEEKYRTCSKGLLREMDTYIVSVESQFPKSTN